MKRLAQLREAAGLTRMQLGAKAAIHPSHVGAIENGRQVPRGDGAQLRRLADALGWEGEPAALLDEVKS